MRIQIRKRCRWILGGVWIFLFMGCMGEIAHKVSPEFQAHPPRSIAVLPVLNETVSLKAPELLRPILSQRLSRKGYEVPGTESIDIKLQEKDIWEAGQIHSMTPQELGKLLGTDALLYSAVTEFNTTYMVVYASMTVGARFWLVDTRSGNRIWESEHEVKEKKMGFDSRSIQDALSFAALQSYQPYMEQVVDGSMATLPNGPLYVEPPAAGCLLPAKK